jgi:hypothetical protein
MDDRSTENQFSGERISSIDNETAKKDRKNEPRSSSAAFHQKTPPIRGAYADNAIALSFHDGLAPLFL